MHSSFLEAPWFLEAPSPRRCQSHRVRLADGSYMLVHRVRLADGSYIAPISRDDFSENFTPSLPHHHGERLNLCIGGTHPKADSLLEPDEQLHLLRFSTSRARPLELDHLLS